MIQMINQIILNYLNQKMLNMIYHYYKIKNQIKNNKNKILMIKKVNKKLIKKYNKNKKKIIKKHIH